MAAEQSNLIPTTGYASIASRAYGQGDFFFILWLPLSTWKFVLILLVSRETQA